MWLFWSEPGKFLLNFKVSEADVYRSVIMFTNCKKCILNKNGWGTFYTVYTCIENMTSVLYPVEKAVTDALWVTFLGQEIRCMWLKISHFM